MNLDRTDHPGPSSARGHFGETEDQGKLRPTGRPGIRSQSEGQQIKRLAVNIERNDWLLLDRHAAETGTTLADLARLHLEPLLKKLRAANA